MCRLTCAIRRSTCRGASSSPCVRNRLIHGYLGIDDDTLWSIVNDDLVPLRAALARLLAGKS